MSFAGYRAAGVDRLNFGVQSFDEGAGNGRRHPFQRRR